jgi:hypothetical protein
MATRTISGVLRKPISNDLWTEATVKFRLTRPFAVSGASYPTQTQSVTSDGTTAVITVVLAVPDSGAARYECILPDNRNFVFFLEAGVGTVNFEDLVAGEFAAGDAGESLQAIIDNIIAQANEYTDEHAAVIASALVLGHVRIGSGLTIDGDGVLSAESGAAAFLDLTDTPPSYAGQALELVRVNAAEDALEFFPSPYALDADLDAHVANTANPHAVTAAQVGALTQAAADICSTSPLTAN